MFKGTLITMFDRPYPADKQMEGQAVSWAIVSGACNKCRHLRRCSSDRSFSFPEDAACMKKKRELLGGVVNA